MGQLNEEIFPTIPWSHSSYDFGSVWKWETPDFVVTVNGSPYSCYWQIAEISSGQERPFADGRTTTFREAEMQVREMIGKAYPPSAGYQDYAGSLATTFTIATGERIDLAPYIGRPVTATAVTGPNGKTQEFHGTATIAHYDLLIVNGDQQVRISPTYLLSIKRIAMPRNARPSSDPSSAEEPATLWVASPEGNVIQ